MDDTEQRRKTCRTLEAFRKGLPTERIERYRTHIVMTLGFDPLLQPRGIGIADATRLAGVQVGTGNAWVRRTRLDKGIARPFPTKRPDSPAGKPLYDPLDVVAWLDWTARKTFDTVTV